MSNPPFTPRYALLHKRDHLLYPDPAQPSGSPLTFPSYDEALEFRTTLFNAHQYRAVKFDSATGRFV